MKTVKLNKADLMAVVKKNYVNHRHAFEKAFEGYRKECVEILEANLKAVRENKAHVVRFSEHPPEDHTDDYQRVIFMLEMSVDSTVELTQQEFAQYVQDDWDWKERWLTSNQKYTSK